MIRSPGSHISINLAERRLSYFEGGGIIKVYPVGVGKPSTPTPTGSYTVISKIIQPGGMLGTRWMGLSIPTGNYGIHGTNNPQSIGGYVSNGCIRMYNPDVEELFPRVVIGTPVNIIPSTGGAETVKLTQGSPSGSIIHTVQSGESLWDIAGRYGKALGLIIQVNNIADPNFIYPGQQITIP